MSRYKPKRERNEYEVWNKDKYVQYSINRGWNPDRVKERVNKVFGGYNFIIAIYQYNRDAYMVYSVDYFNNKIMGN